MKTRWLFVGLLMAALLVSQASPTDAGDRSVPSMLALGDSIAFGWTPYADVRDPADINGYPEVVAQRLGLRTINAACPGEATGGFLSAAGADNGCRGYRAHHSLHIAYRGTQLAFAIQYLASHRDVKLVTLDLGANDALLLRARCARSEACYERGAPAMLEAVKAHLRTALGALRATGYQGPLVVLQYYALIDNPVGIQAVEALNAAIVAAARPWATIVPNGLSAFARAAGAGTYCQAGLLAVQSPDRCDIHPSALGRDVLAEAVLGALHSRRPI